MTPEELISQLKDIHLPAEISFWPPAPGWWIVAIASILAIACSVYGWRKHQRDTAWKKEATVAVSEIKNAAASQSIQTSLHQINLLIKQVALYKTNDTSIKSLSGAQWSLFLEKFLVKKTDSPTFTEQQLTMLAEHQYKPTADADIDGLINSLTQWIKEA